MDRNVDQTAEHTIDLLETRLRAVEYVLSGHQREAVEREEHKSVDKRLRDLGRDLDQIVNESRFMQDLLKLYAQHPHFFHAPLPDDVPSSLDSSTKLSIVLAAASLYPQTASRLVSIHDTPPPTAEASCQIINKVSLADQVHLLQESQSREIAILKQRSASVLQRWYSLDILQTGECWADVESRVNQVEQSIRRARLEEESM